MDSGKLLYEMMKEQDFIAHVRVEEDAFRIQTVKEHSVGTATLSESFASVFGAAAWGKRMAGGMIWGNIQRIVFNLISVTHPAWQWNRK